jgi:predicted secreted protein
MSPTLAIATYFVIWWTTLFAVLPIGLRTQEEHGEVVPGTPESAPQKARIGRLFLINTAVATVVFLLMYYFGRSIIEPLANAVGPKL